MFPLLYIILKLDVAGTIVCIISFVASVEELVITVKNSRLDRDCKGLFLGERDSIVIKKTILSLSLCCIITYYIRKIYNNGV